MFLIAWDSWNRKTYEAKTLTKPISKNCTPYLLKRQIMYVIVHTNKDKGPADVYKTQAKWGRGGGFYLLLLCSLELIITWNTAKNRSINSTKTMTYDEISIISLTRNTLIIEMLSGLHVVQNLIYHAEYKLTIKTAEKYLPKTLN